MKQVGEFRVAMLRQEPVNVVAPAPAALFAYDLERWLAYVGQRNRAIAGDRERIGTIGNHGAHAR